MDNSSKLQLLDYLEVDPESNEVKRDSSELVCFCFLTWCCLWLRGLNEFYEFYKSIFFTAH